MNRRIKNYKNLVTKSSLRYPQETGQYQTPLRLHPTCHEEAIGTCPRIFECFDSWTELTGSGVVGFN